MNKELDFTTTVLETIEGTIEGVIFQNQQNGYTIANFKDIDADRKIVIIGNFASITVGLPILIRGQWIQHPKYGRQFSVSTYETNIPKTIIGIKHYLVAWIEGIGPKSAKLIVDHFGEETLNILDNNPEKLLEVKGIGSATLSKIINSWQEHNKMRDVMLFLQSNNISAAYAIKIYKQYGDEAVRILKINPYVLAEDIFGIGFKTADKIAQNMGIEKNSPPRIGAAIEYTLKDASNDGHTFLPMSKLISDTVALLDVPETEIESILQRMVLESDKIKIEEDRVYLAYNHFAEISVSKNLAKILEKDIMINFEFTPQIEEKIENTLGFFLTQEQWSVLSNLIFHKVVVLTGGPGTGKTATVRAVITLFEELDKTIALAAPTGRAAKRISETTAKTAKTIHRLLEFTPRTGNFSKDHKNPIDADLIVIDEMSMVDVVLMYHLLKAIKPSTRLLLVGDADQLPSVGAGNVLRDIIESNTIKTVSLNKIFRQTEGSSIITNSHRINKGIMPILTNEKDSNFFFFEKEDSDEVVEFALEICTSKIPKKFSFSSLRDIQLIIPMYRGIVGVDNLNSQLQEKLNPSKEKNTEKIGAFRLNDKVMQIKNNYDKEVYNGDIGIITNIDTENRKFFVSFSAYDNKIVEYKFEDLDQLTLAYAITVHKSQGSEYPAVVFLITTSHYPMLQRNLLYTGITRAKKLAVVIGTKKALGIAIKNNKIEERFTWLKERLKAEMRNAECGMRNA